MDFGSMGFIARLLSICPAEPKLKENIHELKDKTRRASSVGMRPAYAAPKQQPFDFFI